VSIVFSTVQYRDGVIEAATALASRRLEARWRVLGLGLGLGSQVLGLGLGLEPKVLIGLGPENVLALLVFKQILCKVLRCSSASVNEHNMYGFCFRYGVNCCIILSYLLILVDLRYCGSNECDVMYCEY